MNVTTSRTIYVGDSRVTVIVSVTVIVTLTVTVIVTMPYYHDCNYDYDL